MKKDRSDVRNNERTNEHTIVELRKERHEMLLLTNLAMHNEVRELVCNSLRLQERSVKGRS